MFGASQDGHNQLSELSNHEQSGCPVRGLSSSSILHGLDLRHDIAARHQTQITSQSFWDVKSTASAVNARSFQVQVSNRS